jgi:hypothetical protein
MRSQKPQKSSNPPEGPAPATGLPYPSILREYASSGFRDEAGSHPHRDTRVTGSRRHVMDPGRLPGAGIETDSGPERYGEEGPYWARKG